MSANFVPALVVAGGTVSATLTTPAGVPLTFVSATDTDPATIDGYELFQDFTGTPVARLAGLFRFAALVARAEAGGAPARPVECRGYYCAAACNGWHHIAEALAEIGAARLDFAADGLDALAAVAA